jgi:HSP20 family protein
MTLVKYQRPLGFLNDFFCEAPFVHAVKADVKETENAYIVEAELPGFKKENVELVCEEGVLTITAKATGEKTEEKAEYVRKERNTSEMTRRFELEGIDEENISAKMEDGVLFVTLPKKSPEKNEKHISIE